MPCPMAQPERAMTKSVSSWGEVCWAPVHREKIVACAHVIVLVHTQTGWAPESHEDHKA